MGVPNLNAIETEAAMNVCFVNSLLQTESEKNF